MASTKLLDFLLGCSGMVFDYAGSTAPSGFLLCYGQAISRTTYAQLFAAIGTTYGAGDGSTTFNIPDLRGRVPAGADNMGGTAAGRMTSVGSGVNGVQLGASAGAETYALTAAQMPQHNHGVTDAGHTHALTDPGHVHTLNDPGHVHALNDPGHVHTLNDPGHNHNTNANRYNITSAGTGTPTPYAGVGNEIDTSANIAAVTGITMAARVTGITANAITTGITESTKTTGITANPVVTGVSTQNAGTGSAHPIVQPTIILNKIIKT